MLLIETLRPPQQRVRHRDFGHMLGHMRELVPPGHIPGGINVPLRSPAARVDPDPLLANPHARLLQLQPVNGGPPPGGRQHRIARQHLAVIQPRLALFHPGHPAPETKLHAFPGKTVPQNGGMRRIVPPQNPLSRRDHHHFRPQTPERLRHLDPHRTRSQHQQPPRPFRQLEQTLVRERRLRKFGLLRPAARRNHKEPRAQPTRPAPVRHFHRVRIQEPRAPRHHLHAQPFHVRRRICLFIDMLPDTPHVLHHPGENDLRLGRRQSEPIRGTDLLRRPRRSQQRLTRDTPRPRAFATQPAPLDQRRLRP